MGSSETSSRDEGKSSAAAGELSEGYQYRQCTAGIFLRHIYLLECVVQLQNPYMRRGGDDNERPFFPPLDALDAVEDGGSCGTSSPLRQRAIAMSGIPDAVAPEA